MTAKLTVRAQEQLARLKESELLLRKLSHEMKAGRDVDHPLAVSGRVIDLLTEGLMRYATLAFHETEGRWRDVATDTLLEASNLLRPVLK